MKVLLILGLVFGILASFANGVPRTTELRENVAVTPKATDLKVSLAADKRKYKRGERIKLEVLLINNNGVKDIFIYGTLEFGYRGSFMLYRRDAKGKDIPTRFFPEAHTLPPEPNDTSAFVKLPPNHFLGTYYQPLLQHLNMERPGRYSMWVEYQCPISIADVRVRPFWGSENGIIKSNVVSIEVLP